MKNSRDCAPLLMNCVGILMNWQKLFVLGWSCFVVCLVTFDALLNHLFRSRWAYCICSRANLWKVLRKYRLCWHIQKIHDGSPSSRTLIQRFYGKGNTQIKLNDINIGLDVQDGTQGIVASVDSLNVQFNSMKVGSLSQASTNPPHSER